jgi:tetratricopeptide (TPR) repeat protein
LLEELMKTAICKLLVLVYLLPFAALGQSNVDARIKRVEQGLLPPVLIKGDSAWSIEERMKHWKVPGLSVAVIKLPEAIAYFKLNVEFYPKSWNVYDSLAEAYMANGEKELAIANYKKSLELNPKNTNGAGMLKKLGVQ